MHAILCNFPNSPVHILVTTDVAMRAGEMATNVPYTDLGGLSGNNF